MSSFFRRAILGLMIFVAVSHVPSLPAATGKQAEAVKRLRRLLVKAGRLYKARQFRESVEIVKQVQRQLHTLPDRSDVKIRKMTAPVYKSLERAHALLELEGFNLPPLRKPVEVNQSVARASLGQISFVRDVAPILVEHCRDCHVQNAKGDFSMSNFPSLLRGTKEAGKVVLPGDAKGSRLIEVLESGDMPRGGGNVSADELKKLRTWIDQGAKFDGEEKSVPLTRLIGTSHPTQPAVPLISRATGNESVRFALQLASILEQRCTGCHGVDQARNEFRVDTFARLMAGGESGPAVLPGQVDKSLLINKLKGTASGQRMPAGQPPLSEEIIHQFAKWVAEGAKFDGTDVDIPLAQLSDIAFAREATPEEMSSKRAERSRADWELGLPGIGKDEAETDHFLILGNVGDEVLEEIGQMAEVNWRKIGAALKLSPENSAIKGKVTLFVFEQRYDYSEFGKMVEQRELPFGSVSHWHLGILDAYAAIVVGHTSPKDRLPVTQALAGVLVASMGEAPHWFVEGTARVVTASLDSRAKHVRQWERELGSATNSMTQADDFIFGRLAPDQSNLVSYGFVKFLKKNGRQYHRLVSSIRKGQDFSEAFLAAFGATPEQVANQWWLQSKRSR